MPILARDATMVKIEQLALEVKAMERPPIRVLLVDDTAEVLRDLQVRLSEYPDFQVVGTAGGCKEAIQALERDGADLVFTDIQMGGRHRLCPCADDPAAVAWAPGHLPHRVC